MTNTFNYEDYINIEIEYLEKEKEKLLNQLNEINKKIHKINYIYNNLYNIKNVKISIKDLIDSLKYLTQKDINIKINIISSFYKGDTLEEINKSEEIMNYQGSDLFINIDNNETIYYSHIFLFNSLLEKQLDGKTLLKHSSPIKRTTSLCDLVIDKNIENIICNFNLDKISFNSPIKNNDYLNILEEAIIYCITNNKYIELDNNYKTYNKRIIK